jgi:hypothetical protein
MRVEVFPNISGRSRQGVPTRAIQSIASRNKRLSAPDRPGSPILPNRSGATRSHCASFRTNRSKAASHWEALNQGSSSMGAPSSMSTGLSATGGVPADPAPDRRTDRALHQPAWSRSRYSQPHHPEPPGRDFAGLATGNPGLNPRTCSWTARARGTADREAWYEDAPVRTKAHTTDTPFLTSRSRRRGLVAHIPSGRLEPALA